jgi:hypothetical protein
VALEELAELFPAGDPRTAELRTGLERAVLAAACLDA